MVHKKIFQVHLIHIESTFYGVCPLMYTVATGASLPEDV